MNLFRLIIIFVLQLAFSVNYIYSNSYELKGVTKADGLSDLLVNVIYKDQKGFIWLGTGKGLDRFDGVRVKHYPFNHLYEEQRNRINTICETTNSNIYVGNDIGLWNLDKTTGELTQVYEDIVDGSVNSLLYDGAQHLYIGTDKGFYMSDFKSVSHIVINEDAFSLTNEIRGLTKDDKGNIWLSTVGGVVMYNPTTGEVTEIKYKDKQSGFRDIIYLKDVLYIGTYDTGIVRYDVKTGEYSGFIDLGSGIISSISTDSDDLIYVSTDGNGVFFISAKDERILKSFRHDPNNSSSIRSNSIYSLLVDEKERMWIGYYQDGFDYTIFQNNLFETYKFEPYFDSANLTVRSFIINGDQKLIGTRDGLYFIDEHKKFAKKIDRTVLQSDLILSLKYYNDKYFIGTYDAGLYILSSDGENIYRLEAHNAEHLKSGHVFCFSEDKNNNLLIGTSNGLVRYNVNDSSIELFNSTNSPLPEGNVYDIFFDSTGKGWVCCEKGMALIEPATGNIRTNLFPETFFHKEKIRMVYEDHNKCLYFLPEKGNLFVSDINMKSFEEVDLPISSYMNVLMSIVEDDDNYLWLASDGGLFRLSDDGYRLFSNIDGVPNPLFTNNSVYKSDDNKLWFGNSKGLISIDLSDVDNSNYYNSEIVLSDILINGKSLTPNQLEKALASRIVELKSEQNNIVFRFANLAYSNPLFSSFEYKLLGVNEKWNTLNLRNEHSFYNLSSGKYKLDIRHPGDDASLISFDLRVKSKSQFFNILFILLFVALAVYSSYIIYMRRKNKTDDAVALVQPDADVSDSNAADDEKYKTIRMDDNQCVIMLEELNQYMKKERPYMNPSLRINDLAEALDTSSHNLSYLFNQYLEVSYYDFVNEFRIEEFKRIVKNEDSSKYTLETLAELSGFSSRTSFFRSFKKSTGLTPNEYIRSLNNK